MRVFSLFLTFFVLSFSSLANQSRTFYLSSSSGDDSRTALQAQNPATPWKSIQKLNSFFASLQPGDSVLFKRGDTFYGTINVSKSGKSSAPIVLSAYGTGDKPVISGFTQLTSWTSKGKGVYESTMRLPNTNLMMVLFNGRPQPMGRYPNTDQPNKGYLTFDGASNGLSLSDSDLPASPNWTGAEVVVRSNHWTLNKATIGAHLGTKLVFASPMERSAANYGYFIQNDIRTLDQPGEWYYNPLTKKLSVFFGTLSPARFSVQAATLENLLYSNKYSYITVENLSFQGSNADVVDITSGAGMTLRACEVLYAGRDAIDVMGSPTTPRIENCLINHTNSSAIDISGYTINSVIRGNTIRNTGLFEGMCESGNKSSIAIHAKSHGHTIQGNTIDSTGYVAVRFTGNNIVVKNNLITNFNLIKDDGGAVTVNSHGDNKGVSRRIAGNIILNGPGALDGTDRAWVASSGIYLDDKVNGVEISGNTIAGCVKTGIYVHNTSEVTLRSNTLYNNGSQLTLTHDGLAPNHPIRKLDVKDNILFSPQEKQSVMIVKSIKNDLKKMGEFDNNYYCRPVDENMIIRASYTDDNGKSEGNIYELEGWRDRFGYDKASRKTARQLPPYTIKALLGTNKFANGSFTSDISGLKTSPSGIGSWTKAKLDGGTFQGTVSPSAGQSEVQLPVGALSATKNYVLRFSVQSTKDTVFNLMVYGGSTKLTETRSFKVGVQRREYEFFFPLPEGASTNNAKVFINTKAKDFRFWLDNVVMQEADVTVQDSEKQIRFEYNGTATTKTVALDAGYVDVKGKSYSKSIILQPYTSVILLQTTPAVIEKDTASILFDSLSKSISVVEKDKTILLSNITTSDNKSVNAKLNASDENGKVPEWLTLNGKKIDGISFKTGAKISFNVDAAKLPAGRYSVKITASELESKSGVLEILLTVTPAPIASQTTLRVNFQDSETQTPNDWVSDFGQPFGPRASANQGSGNTYGWLTTDGKTPLDLTVNGRNRKSISDELLVTLMHFQAKGEKEGVWEAKVVNGTYEVKVAVGDHNYFDSKHNITIEGVPAIENFVPKSGTRFKTATVTVTVNDGKLTVTSAGGKNTKINYITITPAVSMAASSSNRVMEANLAEQESMTSVAATATKKETVLEPVIASKLTIDKIYPNPSTNHFTVLVLGKSNQPIRLQIVDFSGRTVETRTGVTTNTSIQVGQQLPRGMYLLQVVQGDQKAEMKLSKM